METTIEELIRQVTALIEVVKHNSNDVSNLRDDLSNVQTELRESVKELRIDLALSINRQNAAIKDAQNTAAKAAEVAQSALIKLETDSIHIPPKDIPLPEKTETGELRAQRKKMANHIVRIMNDVFSDGELRELCVDFGVDYESLLGHNKKQRIEAFVGYFERRNSLRVLRDWLVKIRPKETWPEDVT